MVLKAVANTESDNASITSRVTPVTWLVILYDNGLATLELVDLSKPISDLMLRASNQLVSVDLAMLMFDKPKPHHP
jgi:hypothetical protein